MSRRIRSGSATIVLERPSPHPVREAEERIAARPDRSARRGMTQLSRYYERGHLTQAQHDAGHAWLAAWQDSLGSSPCTLDDSPRGGSGGFPVSRLERQVQSLRAYKRGLAAMRELSWLGARLAEAVVLNDVPLDRARLGLGFERRDAMMVLRGMLDTLNILG